MNKYRVVINRTLEQVGELEIEAPSSYAAKERALREPDAFWERAMEVERDIAYVEEL